jgi:hypothetical protein
VWPFENTSGGGGLSQKPEFERWWLDLRYAVGNGGGE